MCYIIVNRKEELCMVVRLDFKSKFSREVETYVQENGGTYIEAVLEIGEKFEIEPDVAGKNLTKPIIEKIQIEGGDMNLLPRKKSKELPFNG
tara:strand:+ start:493 stop:768 length:276 start_codon:yes stop_codon:yes gene_type:complete